MRPLAAYSAVHFALGATLWVLGMVRDSLALAGFGFLVVFDMMGLVNAVATQWLDEARVQRTDDAMRGASVDELKRPFGVRRIETLLDFSLVVYLLFAGIYMCKENVEHALLASSAPHEEDRAGIVLPRLVLAAALLLCVGTNVVLRNHARLASACGMSLDAGVGLDGKRSRGRHARHASVLTLPFAVSGTLSLIHI